MVYSQIEMLSKLDNNTASEELIKIIAEQFEIVDILSRNYRNVYKINTKKGTMGIVKLDGYVLPALEGERGNEMIYRDIIDAYVKERVYHEDRKKVLHALELEVVMANLANSDEYSSSFRVVDKRRVHYCQFKIFKLTGDHDYDLIAGFQIIDDIIAEAREKEALIIKSTTDEMTGCLNRRAYEQAMQELSDKDSDRDVVYIAMDVNGLKVTNDNLGHAAGDELIMGAASCMKHVMSPYGEVYRTGGDEFTAILYVSEKKCESVLKEFEECLAGWKGEIVPEVSVSTGVIYRTDCPDSSMFEISKMADTKMYEDKSRYYKRRGIDRRGRNEAYAATGRLYKLAAKGDLKEDTLQIPSASNGNGEKLVRVECLSEWLAAPLKQGIVHPDDEENYKTKADINYISEQLEKDSRRVTILFRKLCDGDYKYVLFEIIPANDYMDTHKTIYLYLKNIDD